LEWTHARRGFVGISDIFDPSDELRAAERALGAHSVHTSSPHRRAFTLVELLVVVAILAIVVALSFPALALLQQRARVVHCSANLRSLQLASLAYAQDNAGWLIDARLPHGGHDQGSDESFVDVLARRNYCDTSLIRSPLDTSPHWAIEQGGEGIPVSGANGALRRTSYGLNNHLAREFSPWAAIDPSLATDRLSKVADHAGTVQLLLMAETGPYAAADHPHVEGWGASPQAPTIASAEVSVAAVSGGRASPESQSNWSFLDGHVETALFGAIYVDAERNRLDPAVSALFLRSVDEP
jgi:prepilin-type N-terminal cleavage/methylation domain-containing protein/prepilin-type processing-associated H-X9-DG protein